jgi:hypothetical protein
VELDTVKPIPLMTQALQTAKDETLFIPVYQQPMAWATRQIVRSIVQASDKKPRLWLTAHEAELMLVFILKRMLNAAGVMLAAAALAFATFRFVGDPVEMMLNEQASVAQRQELRERLGLHRGLPEQYAAFVINAARGDFGVFYRNQQDVFPLVAERFPATFELVIVATVLSLLIGLPLGSIPALTGGPSLPSFCRGCLLWASRCPVSRWVSC